jgi:hypothetical protein
MSYIEGAYHFFRVRGLTMFGNSYICFIQKAGSKYYRQFSLHTFRVNYYNYQLSGGKYNERAFYNQ